LSKPQIISLLRGGVLATRIADLIKDRGISFMPTADDLGDIRAAGGNDEVIQAVQQAALPPR
jgi:cytochrome c1